MKAIPVCATCRSGVRRSRPAVIVGTSDPPSGVTRGTPSSRVGSRWTPVLDPGTQHLDLLLLPGLIARHLSGLDSLQDVPGVIPDVVVGPQVKPRLHRLPVRFSEQRPEICFEWHSTSPAPSRGATGVNRWRTRVLPVWHPVRARWPCIRSSVGGGACASDPGSGNSGFITAVKIASRGGSPLRSGAI